MTHYLLFIEFDEKHVFIFSLVIGMEIGTDFQEKSNSNSSSRIHIPIKRITIFEFN